MQQLDLVDTYESTTADILQVKDKLKHKRNVNIIMQSEFDFDELALKIKILALENSITPQEAVKEKISFLKLMHAQPIFEFDFAEHPKPHKAKKKLEKALKKQAGTAKPVWSIDNKQCHVQLTNPENAQKFWQKFNQLLKYKPDEFTLNFTQPPNFNLLAELGTQGPLQMQHYLEMFKETGYEPQRPGPSDGYKVKIKRTT